MALIGKSQAYSICLVRKPCTNMPMDYLGKAGEKSTLLTRFVDCGFSFFPLYFVDLGLAVIHEVALSHWQAVWLHWSHTDKFMSPTLPIFGARSRRKAICKVQAPNFASLFKSRPSGSPKLGDNNQRDVVNNQSQWAKTLESPRIIGGGPSSATSTIAGENILGFEGSTLQECKYVVESIANIALICFRLPHPNW